MIDGDALAREITQPGSPVLEKLAERFGEDICKGESLDRSLLAERAFASEKARRDLNSITHPAITELALAREKALQGHRAIVLDAAALLESELAALCAHILIITAPEELRLARILARGGVTEEAARRRIEAQRRMDFHVGAGRVVIQNEGSKEALRREIEKALGMVLRGAGVAAGGAGSTDPPPGG